MRRIFFLILVVCFVFSSYATISKSVSFKDFDFNKTDVEDISFYKLNSNPGEPKLPFWRLRYLLPANVNAQSVSVEILKPDIGEITGEYDIAPAENDYEKYDIVSQFRSLAEDEIYSKNEFFPASHIYKAKNGAYREFQIVTIYLFPYRYNPVTKQMVKLNKCDLKINYTENENSFTSAVNCNKLHLSNLKCMVENYEEMIGTYNVSNSRQTSNLTIATTNSIKGNLTNLNAFINNKKARNFNVEVITEDQWGGGSGDAAADNLRNWLENNYLLNGIDYLLIIGNPNPDNGDMAMKNAYAYYSGKIAHTDFYFSELTGDWDADGDCKYGETDDVKATNGIDAISDISVGRIPCYNGNYSAVDNILSKCIAYESEKNDAVQWRKNMLLAMDGYYGSEGPEVGEKIKDDIENANSSWSFYRIYCNHLLGPDEGILTPDAVTNAWSSNPYGLVSWLTHGSETAAMNIFSTSYVSELNDNYPSFVIMGSCLNGKPTYSNNLAYSVLQNGGIGVISGSETTIFKQPMGDFVGSSYNHGLIHAMSKNIALEGGFVSDAFNKARHDADMGCWKNYCCYNLYGDPTLGIEVYGVEGSTSKSVVVNNFSREPNIDLIGKNIQISNIASNGIVEIYNAQGKILYTEKVLKGYNRIDLNSISFGNSILICRVNANNKIFVKTITFVK